MVRDDRRGPVRKILPYRNRVKKDPSLVNPLMRIEIYGEGLISGPEPCLIDYELYKLLFVFCTYKSHYVKKWVLPPIFHIK